MNKNLKLRAIVWEIIVPIVLYYIVFLSAMYFIFAFIGHTASTYMIAQIISAAITIPFMYFASYKPTQQMFVKKPKIGRALFINVLWVIVITLFISFALNNIITMSPLIGLSEGYARANESFYGGACFQRHCIWKYAQNNECATGCIFVGAFVWTHSF